MSFISLLQTAGGAAGTAQAGSAGQGWFSIVCFAVIILIFYFFMIRPQSKKQKETQKMIEALKKGDKIVTIGGIHGVVSSTKEKTVIVKVDDGCKIEFSKSAIAAVEADKTAETDDKKSKKEEAEKSADSETK